MVTSLHMLVTYIAMCLAKLEGENQHYHGQQTSKVWGKCPSKRNLFPPAWIDYTNIWGVVNEVVSSIHVRCLNV